jgi:hypothetical protein
LEKVSNNELNAFSHTIDSSIVLSKLNFHRIDVNGYDMLPPAPPESKICLAYQFLVANQVLADV